MSIKKKKKANIAPAIYMTLAAIIFTVLIKTVNVAAIGPLGSEVGFSGINGFMSELIGYNKFWHKLTDILGLLAMGVLGVMGMLGLSQWVNRKKLFDVDINILITGIYYLIILAMYFIFDKVALNYRPVVLDEGLEASYPSSHTVLICSVMCAAAMRIREYVKNQKVAYYAAIGLLCLVPITVIGRLLSGVHWFTDIIGGILVSAAMVFWYKWAIDRFGEKKKLK